MKIISRAMEYFGLAFNPDKVEWPVTNPILLGIHFDTEKLEVEVKEGKLKELIFCTGFILDVKWYWIDSAESLTGGLNWVAIFHWPACAFLRRWARYIARIIAKEGRSHAPFQVPRWALLDIEWWHWYLKALIPTKIVSIVGVPTTFYEGWTDGATNGSKPNWEPAIGGYVFPDFFAAPLPSRFREFYRCRHNDYVKEFAIPHFEMLAMVVMVKLFAERWKGENVEVTFWRDSTHAQSALRNKSSGDEFLMLCTRWICREAVRLGFRFRVERISSEDNKLADYLSRCRLDLFWKRIEAKQADGWTGRMNRQQTPVVYPNAVYDFFNSEG